MMSGKSTVINMTTISTNRNGIFCFTIFSSDCFDVPWATNKFMPSGGVRKPMTSPKRAVDILLGNNQDRLPVCCCARSLGACLLKVSKEDLAQGGAFFERPGDVVARQLEAIARTT